MSNLMERDIIDSCFAQEANALRVLGLSTSTGETVNNFYIGTSVTSGKSGTSGSSGAAGAKGEKGDIGYDGFDGTSGTSGTTPKAINGTSGTSGKDGQGYPGPEGSDGTSGSSGKDGNFLGTSGTSGNSGIPDSLLYDDMNFSFYLYEPIETFYLDLHPSYRYSLDEIILKSNNECRVSLLLDDDVIEGLDTLYVDSVKRIYRSDKTIDGELKIRIAKLNASVLNGKLKNKLIV